MAQPNGNGNGAAAHAAKDDAGDDAGSTVLEQGQDKPKATRRRRAAAADKPNLKVHNGGKGADRETEDPTKTVYKLNWFDTFVRKFRQSLSDMHTAQADLRELWKAETGRGLNKMAAELALKLDTKIRNDKIAALEAYQVLDDARALLDRMGHSEPAKDDLLQRAQEAEASPPV